MITVGIECESLEGERWGIGRIVEKTLTQIAKTPNLSDSFRFRLFFKKEIPDMACLDHPIFEKKILGIPLLSKLSGFLNPASFSLYYYILLPMYVWWRPVDVMYFPNYMLPILFRGKSIVLLTEDVYLEARERRNPFRYRLAYRIFTSWAARHATMIATISRASRKMVTQLFHIPQHRTFVNHLGIEIADQSQHADTVFNTEFILYVGQAFPRRRLYETILAFEKIARSFPNMQLRIVGHDRYHPPVIQTLVATTNQRLGRQRIIYTASVSQDELISLYKNARATIYISANEAFGLPPLEALAHGSVPIVANTEVTRELFGEYAFFVENDKDVDCIARTITTALTDKSTRNNIQTNGPALIRSYTWDGHMRRLLDAITHIVYEKN